MTQDVVGGYVRHRDRMVQQSVFEDLTDTLIAFQWLAGSTAHEVWNPNDLDVNGNPIWEIATTDSTQVLPLLEGSPLNLIDYFPEQESDASVDDPTGSRTAPNTFALDTGTRIDETPRELGSTATVVLYRFNMAFFAVSDAVAQAIFADLADRYKGRVVRGDAVDLWNYNSADTNPVVRMSVESFRFQANADPSIAPHNIKLYLAELRVEDEVD